MRSIKNTVIFLILLLILNVLIYGYVSFCIADVKLRSFLSELIQSLINGLILAQVVFTTGILIEEKYRRETKQAHYQQKIISLKNILKNTFRRRKSSYNFTNRTPSFYFDNSWINPTYEVLTSNNREWISVLREYEGTMDSEIVKKLIEYTELMDSALINTEKIDSEIENLLNTTLVGSMSSSYHGDRISAKKDTNFAYWVFRATITGIGLNEIIFGMPAATDEQISREKVTRLIKNAEAFTKQDKLKILIKQYERDKKNLVEGLREIEIVLRRRLYN